MLDILEKDVHYNISYAVKAKSQQFTRRKSKLVKKAHELVRLSNVDLEFIIHKNGKYYTFQLTDHKSWPFTINDIVGIFGANNNEALIESIIENVIPIAYQFIILRLRVAKACSKESILFRRAKFIKR